jgi:hypothetical protein
MTVSDINTAPYAIVSPILYSNIPFTIAMDTGLFKGTFRGQDKNNHITQVFLLFFAWFNGLDAVIISDKNNRNIHESF